MIAPAMPVGRWPSLADDLDDGPDHTDHGPRTAPKSHGRPEAEPVVAEPRHLPVVRMADVMAERLSFLWQGRIPLRKLTIIDGDPGLGKSTLTIHIAAAVSRGLALPGGKPSEPASVLLASVEDGLADTIRPRLEAAGADLARVFAIDPAGNSVLSLPDDIEAIEVRIREVGARLLVLDPIMALLGEKTNAHRDQDVRRALAPLAAMADRTGVAVVIVRHLNKASGGSALYRGGGSIGISGAARSVLLVAQDRDDETARVLCSVKSNLGPLAPALRWRLVGTPSGVARIEWEGEVSINADELLAPTERGGNAEDAVLAALPEDGSASTVRSIRQAVRDSGASVANDALAGILSRLKAKGLVDTSLAGGWRRLPEPGPEAVRTTDRGTDHGFSNGLGAVRGPVRGPGDSEDGPAPDDEVLL